MTSPVRDQLAGDALAAGGDVLPACVDGNASRYLRRPLDAIIGIGEHGKAADGARQHDSPDLNDTLEQRHPGSVS